MWALILLLIASSEALPQGAPTSVCRTLRPNHGGGIPPQTGIAPYSLIARRQGGTVFISITSSLGVRFQGFALQGRTRNKDIIGVFDLSSTSDAHTIDCNDQGDTLTHNGPNDKESLDVVWKPPPDYEGEVVFV